MRKTPRITDLETSHDFHDSSLISFEYDPINDCVKAILSTPNEWDELEAWQIIMEGILGFQMESLGDGNPNQNKIPPEVYDVYDHTKSPEITRCKERLAVLEFKNATVHHIIFASSFLRGWGKNEKMDGMSVICRRVEVVPAPAEFLKAGILRPRIPGAPEE